MTVRVRTPVHRTLTVEYPMTRYGSRDEVSDLDQWKPGRMAIRLPADAWNPERLDELVDELLTETLQAHVGYRVRLRYVDPVATPEPDGTLLVECWLDRHPRQQPQTYEQAQADAARRSG